jgi:DNA uptake protein ComE-like DNA-binding protein
MDLITLTKKERNGIAWFLIFTATILTLPKILRYLSSNPNTTNDIVDLSKDTMSHLELAEYKKTDYWHKQTPKKYEKVAENNFNFNGQLFEFDPNFTSEDSLKLLGFSEKSIQMILSSRSKGFTFFSVRDLERTYGMDGKFIDRVAPYFKRVKSNSYTTSNVLTYEQSKITIRRIELNNADSLDLEQLPKIGETLARRIINYRKRLGGYINKEQLVSDNILHDSIYQAVQSYIDVDTSAIKRININTANYRSMIKHPYFTPKMTTAIEKYRKQHGKFQYASDIRKIIAIKKEEGMKILPYITVEDNDDIY